MSEVATAPTALAEFQHVTKWYGAVIGVNDVTVRLNAGITGLLGPNGAGKTTLIKLLIGQLRPSLGEVFVTGCPARSAPARRQIGYCPDADVFYEEMTGRQFVVSMARLHGMSNREARARTAEVLEDVQMQDRADKPLRACSKGMRQRIKLAQALVHNPAVLVVDEPLNGVDPVGRMELMDLFRRCAARGQAVLVSSHILDEMDELAEQIVFMGRGRILAEGTLTQIRALFASQPVQIRIDCPRPRELASRLIGWEQVLELDLTGGIQMRLKVVNADTFYVRLADLVLQDEIEIERLETTDVTTEAAFESVMAAAARF